MCLCAHIPKINPTANHDKAKILHYSKLGKLGESSMFNYEKPIVYTNTSVDRTMICLEEPAKFKLSVGDIQLSRHWRDCSYSEPNFKLFCSIWSHTSFPTLMYGMKIRGLQIRMRINERIWGYDDCKHDIHEPAIPHAVDKCLLGVIMAFSDVLTRCMEFGIFCSSVQLVQEC